MGIIWKYHDNGLLREVVPNYIVRRQAGVLTAASSYTM